MQAIAIAVRGVVAVPRVRREQWIWLRVYSDASERKRSVNHDVEYCVGKTPLLPTSFDCIPPFRLQPHGVSLVRVELWTAASADAAFMQFGGSCSIDAGTWTSDDGAERWYDLEPPYLQKKAAWAETLRDCSAYHDTAPLNAGKGGCVLVRAAFVRHDTKLPQQPIESPPVPTDEDRFHFVIPHKAIRQRASLRRLNVRELVEQSRVSVLEELLPTTLYGNGMADDSSESKCGQGLRQAMILLQLSCQYALHSTHELERCRSELDVKIDTMYRRMNRLRQSKANLDERRCNLTRERDVLDCALDGTKVLLQEVDPERNLVLASAEED